MIFLNALSIASSPSSASTSRAMSMKRLDSAGSSWGGVGLLVIVKKLLKSALYINFVDTPKIRNFFSHQAWHKIANKDIPCPFVQNPGNRCVIRYRCSDLVAVKIARPENRGTNYYGTTYNCEWDAKCQGKYFHGF